MRVTILFSDQTPDNRPHVHAEGCADLRKYRGEGVTIDAESRAAVSDDVYPPSDFQCESGEYVNELRFFPCCKALKSNTKEVA